MVNFKMFNFIAFHFTYLVVVDGVSLSRQFPSSADQEHLLNTVFLRYWSSIISTQQLTTAGVRAAFAPGS